VIGILLHPVQTSPGADPQCGAGRGARGIEWAPTFERALEQARSERRFVMVDPFTSWCGWCRRLVTHTYPNSEVADRVSRVVAVRVCSFPSRSR